MAGKSTIRAELDSMESSSEESNSVGNHTPEKIRGFREILDGKHDDIPESYFLNAGSIDDVLAKVHA